MPFAGQTVVERNLPFTCLLSNYLSLTPGAMQGLVKHPFSDESGFEPAQSGSCATGAGRNRHAGC